MSIDVMKAVWDSDIGPTSKLVLLSLADNANESGYCWPSQEYIARRASISTRALRDHLNILEATGMITIVERGNGRGNSTKYRVNLAALKAAKAEDFVEKAEESVVKAEDTFRQTQEPSEPKVNNKARELFQKAYGKPTPIQEEALCVIENEHPPECVRDVFTRARTWGGAFKWLGECLLLGHEPNRSKPKEKPNGAAPATADRDVLGLVNTFDFEAADRRKRESEARLAAYREEKAVGGVHPAQAGRGGAGAASGANVGADADGVG